jgi:hypothetical protein|nr:MAG TPA: hypothetical protein [Caudoviricetes sp.]
METIESLKKQLNEVNRDINGMLLAGATTEKAQKVLKDAREYRASLEDDLLAAVRKQGKTDEPVIVGIMIIPLN